MKRRGFLKFLGIGAALTANTRILAFEDKAVVPRTIRSPEGNVFIDIKNRQIDVMAPVTGVALYSYLCDEFDSLELMSEPMPLIAVTRHYFEVTKEWSFGEKSREMISECSWMEDGEIYSTQWCCDDKQH